MKDDLPPAQRFARSLLVGSALLFLPPSCALSDSDSEEVAEAPLAGSSTCAGPATFTFSTSGDSTVALSGGQPVAWFTAGSYSVRMVGPTRTFTWGKPVSVTFQSTAWVRTLGAPFRTDMPAAARKDWLNAARAVNCSAPTGTADVIAVAFEYVEGTPLHAGYAYGADFHDYLGTSWKPPDGSVRQPDPAMFGELDCSGYMRLIWGSRINFTYKGTGLSLPLSLDAVTGMLPRRSYQQYLSGPGKVIVPFRRVPTGGSPATGGTPTAAEASALAAGDLVFFDMSCDYGATTPTCSADPAVAIGHVGMFLGKDNASNLRFLSARTSSDGPTIGNVSGWSILNSTSASSSFARRFRAARRL